MSGAHRWLGWIAAGAVGGAALVGGALAAPAPQQAAEMVHGRPFGPSGEVLRQIHQARPELTAEQKQQWLARVDAILAAAVKDGKLAQAQADRIRAQVASGQPGFGLKRWHRGPGFESKDFQGRHREGMSGQALSPEQKQK